MWTLPQSWLEATTALSPYKSLPMAAVSYEANKILFLKLPLLCISKAYLQINNDEGFLPPTGQVCQRLGMRLAESMPGDYPCVYALPLMLRLSLGYDLLLPVCSPRVSNSQTIQMSSPCKLITLKASSGGDRSVEDSVTFCANSAHLNSHLLSL